MRSFTVPAGSNFVCVPLDGSGPLIASAGEQVLIVVAETWDRALNEAMRRLTEPPDGER